MSKTAKGSGKEARERISIRINLEVLSSVDHVMTISTSESEKHERETKTPRALPDAAFMSMKHLIRTAIEPVAQIWQLQSHAA